MQLGAGHASETTGELSSSNTTRDAFGWQKNLAAENTAGLDTVMNYPKCSPDLNAIEGWWKRLKDVLTERAPEHIETRPAFIARLRRTVRWLNQRARADGLKLCTDQKERAREVLRLKGARCSS